MNERRLRPVLFQFLLPSFLIMLLPFLTCAVFFTLEYYSCRKQAYEKTCRVNEYAQALMKDYLNSYSPGDEQDGSSGSGSSSLSEQPEKTGVRTKENDYARPAEEGEGQDGGAQNHDPSDSIISSDESDIPRDIIEHIGYTADQTDYWTHLFLLSSDFDILYPSEKEQTEAMTILAADLIQAIQNQSLPNHNSLTSTDGITYLVSFTKTEYPSVGTIYIISCYSTLTFSRRIWLASILILLISLTISVIVLAALWFSARKVSDSLHLLCQKAELIDNYNSAPLEPAFNILEPEELRLTLNQLSAHLQKTKERQEKLILQASHKLHNRLMAIDGYAREIEENDHPLSHKAGRSIRTESAELIDDVSKIITIFRLEDSLEKLPLEPVPLIELLYNCLDRFSVMNTKDNLNVQIKTDSQEIWVFGNEDLLETILDNLMSNSLRYARNEVIFAIQSVEGKIHLSVMDDGPGLSEQVLVCLFERFYTGPSGNFGLGLPIALSAAKRMDGTLTAGNRPEGGAVFTLVLQAAEKPIYNLQK